MTPDSNQTVLTAATVARMLATTEANLAQLRYRSDGPAYLKLGRSIRYLDSDVRAYISANRVTTREQA